MQLRSLCVFCGSSSGVRAEYQEAAAALGELLARRGIRLVYGGGNVGLMGVVADACLAHGGHVVGVIPESLERREVAHRGLTELRVVESMHRRKAMMADLADGFVALPGGIGTFEELFEIWTWGQLGIHQKPCGILNVAGYYNHLIGLADHAVREGFLRAAHRASLLVDTDVERLLEALEGWSAPGGSKWVDR